MFAVLFGTIFIVLTALLFRAALANNIFGRLLAVNVAGTVVAVLLAAIGALMREGDYFDIALLYILLNFSSTLALLRFFSGQHIPADLLGEVSRIPVPDAKSGDGEKAAGGE